MIKEMKVRSADSATGDFDDGVPFVLDLWIRDTFATDIRCPAPDQCFHFLLRSLVRSNPQHSSNINGVHWFQTGFLQMAGKVSSTTISPTENWSRTCKVCSCWSETTRLPSSPRAMRDGTVLQSDRERCSRSSYPGSAAAGSSLVSIAAPGGCRVRERPILSGSLPGVGTGEPHDHWIVYRIGTGPWCDRPR